MPLLPPSIVAQICSQQKDQYYINVFRGLATDSAQQFFGALTTLRWAKEINLVVDLIYYSITTGCSLQTLGEEYTNLIQVNSSKLEVPTWKSKFLLIFGHSFAPYLLDRFLRRLESQLQGNTFPQLSEAQKSIYLDAISKLRSLVVTFYRLHLSFFFLHGQYHLFSKRLSQVNYVKYFVNNKNEENEFAGLGRLSIIQASIMLGLQAWNLYKSLRKDENQTLQSHSDLKLKNRGYRNKVSKRKCSLCLDKKEDMTITMCGHLYCWNCIYQWVNTKPECPLCREHVQPKQLIYLKNF